MIIMITMMINIISMHSTGTILAFGWFLKLGNVMISLVRLLHNNSFVFLASLASTVECRYHI